MAGRPPKLSAFQMREILDIDKDKSKQEEKAHKSKKRKSRSSSAERTKNKPEGKMEAGLTEVNSHAKRKNTRSRSRSKGKDIIVIDEDVKSDVNEVVICDTPDEKSGEELEKLNSSQKDKKKRKSKGKKETIVVDEEPVTDSNIIQEDIALVEIDQDIKGVEKRKRKPRSKNHKKSVGKDTDVKDKQNNSISEDSCSVMGSYSKEEKDEVSSGKVLSHADCPFVLETSSEVLVAFNHPSSYVMKGTARLQSLIGEMTVYGYHVSETGKACDLYSPDSHSLLTLTTKCGDSNVDKGVEIVAEHVPDFQDHSFLQQALQTCASFIIVKFQKLSCNICDLVTSYPTFSNLIKLNTEEECLSSKLLPLGMSLLRQCQSTSIKVPQDLEYVIEKWSQAITDDSQGPPVMLICGGRDSGKSTTNRLFMNTALNKGDSIYYLECDVGQSEFTPPGVVSLHKVTEPVIGPPFCHQREGLCSYLYGGLSPRDNPDSYLQCVRSCVQAYRSLETPGPLVVNTMGWMKGLGLQLLIDTVRLVAPTHILQLMSWQRSSNIPPLDDQFYLETSWSDLSRKQHEDCLKKHLPHQPLFHHMESAAASGSTQSKMKPIDHRNLNLLSHLGSDLEPGISLLSREPFYIEWKDVAVHVSHSKLPHSQIMYALNASIVALCHADLSEARQLTVFGPKVFDRPPLFRWIAYGIVRCVDHEEKHIYISTNIPLNRLAVVNTIVKTAVTLPEDLLLTQKCEEALYVDSQIRSAGIERVRPRRYMPRR